VPLVRSMGVVATRWTEEAVLVIEREVQGAASREDGMEGVDGKTEVPSMTM
jgi:hypothetical protein